MLILGVCLTEHDLESNWEGLIKSIQSIKIAFSNDVFVYAVFQVRKESDFNIDNVSFCSIFDEHLITNEFGVSKSRNKIINKSFKIDNAQYLLFHDSSIRWNEKSAKFLYRNREFNPLIKVKYYNINKKNSLIFNFDKKHSEQLKIITNTYVGSYLLKINLIRKIKFDESFGPGDNTTYKSGEDVLFLNSYMNENKLCKVITSNKVYLYHPPRPSDLSKHLIYARGQGKVFQILLREYFNYYYLHRFILFFFNSIIRCVFFRKNSVAILKERLIGFFKN